MAEPVITSTTNPLVKRIRALEQRKHREAEGAFFVEGIRPVWQAVESRAEVEALIVAPELLKSEAAQGLVASQRAVHTRVVEVSRGVFESIAQRENPSGLGAIVHLTRRSLDELPVASDSFFVALAEAGNPGNLGTIIRTVDAVGGSAVILIGASTDPYNPTAVKASMGTLFSVPVARAENLAQVLAWCRVYGVQIITTSDHAPALYWSVQYPRPALYLFGSEGEGLSAEELQQGNLAVRIPMKGAADSLNLAVSVGVLLYEVIRQQTYEISKTSV